MTVLAAPNAPPRPSTAHELNNFASTEGRAPCEGVGVAKVWKDVPRMLHVPRLLPPPPPPRRRHPLNSTLNRRCTRRPLRQACLPPSHPARTPARRQCRWHVARFKSQEAPNRPPSNEGYDWRGAWETATPGEPLGSCWTLAAICSDLSRAKCHLPSRGLAWQRPHFIHTTASPSSP